MVRKRIDGSGALRLTFLDFVVEAILSCAPVRSKAPSPSAGSG